MKEKEAFSAGLSYGKDVQSEPATVRAVYGHRFATGVSSGE